MNWLLSAGVGLGLGVLLFGEPWVPNPVRTGFGIVGLTLLFVQAVLQLTHHRKDA